MLTNEIVRRAVQTEDIAAVGRGVLMEKGRQRLEQGEVDPVTPIFFKELHQGVEALGRKFHDLGVILEGQGHPCVTEIRSQC